MKFCFLVNPFSGGKRGKIVAERLGMLLDQNVFEGEVLLLPKNDAHEQISRACKADRIIVVGGDGTVMQSMQLLTSDSPPVGIIPLGTGNDLAREIGSIWGNSFSELEEALTFFKKSKTREIALWELTFNNSTTKTVNFCNYVSIGFDALVTDRFTNWREERWAVFDKFGKFGNRFGYFITGLRSLPDGFIEPIDISSEEHAVTTKKHRALIFSNISSMMGFVRSNKSSNPFDKKIELLGTNSILDYTKMLFQQFLPITAGMRYGSAQSWKCTSLPKKFYVQADGETLGAISADSFEIKYVRGVNLLVANSLADG